MAVTARIAAVITAVAFDLDGTLLDHEQAARDAVHDWVAARGWQAPEDTAAQWLRLEREHFAAFTTGAITFEEQRRRRLRAFLPPVTDADIAEEDLDDLFAEYATFYESHWVAFDDARATLDDLAAAGYALGVLTNGQRAQQLAKLARVGLLDRFAVVVASSELPAASAEKAGHWPSRIALAAAGMADSLAWRLTSVSCVTGIPGRSHSTCRTRPAPIGGSW